MADESVSYLYVATQDLDELDVDLEGTQTLVIDTGNKKTRKIPINKLAQWMAKYILKTLAEAEGIDTTEEED